MQNDQGAEKPAEKRICYRCLVRDFDEGALMESIRDYVSRIGADIKASDGEYERRLAICTACDRLLSGTCGVCGCYVEMRAAAKNNSCPAVVPKW